MNLIQERLCRCDWYLNWPTVYWCDFVNTDEPSGAVKLGTSLPSWMPVNAQGRPRTTELYWYLFYLTTLPVVRIIQASIIWWLLINNELGCGRRRPKPTLGCHYGNNLACFRVEIWTPVPPKYESGALTTLSRRLVQRRYFKLITLW